MLFAPFRGAISILRHLGVYTYKQNYEANVE